ncbi:hypothetical protein [Streptomyces yanii]|uniref:Uncharacterized protein n=1 Tax=Streptomyces yanii TaxID=78510 RepID=A0ABV5R804_9ACTN
MARYQAELLRLTTEVATHPYWATVNSGAVAARLALEHTHEAADEAA